MFQRYGIHTLFLTEACFLIYNFSHFALLMLSFVYFQLFSLIEDMMKEMKDLKDANKALQDQLKAVSHTFCNYS